mmetsp:Transcript_72524/g.172935  ORF Transcript_72524/g.172935 Transcript_72524/m.172935 type:complete len:92 (-) Transcript_72524:1074-1349(-)
MPPMTRHQNIMSGIPISGRIATHTTPPIPRQHAVAGKHETMQAKASTTSPRQGPMQGTHSASASRGPKHIAKAHQSKAKPRIRKKMVKVWA